MPNNTFQGATLRDLVEEQGGRYLDKTFLFFEEEEISYGKLDEIANKVGNALRSLGVRKGDRVAIYLPNCTEYVLTFFGCFKIGAVAVPINTLLKPPEGEYLLRNSQAKILITNGDNLARIDEIRGSCWDLTRTVVVNARVPEGCVPFDGFYRASSQAPEVAVAADDPAMILYTAGTTGRPKG
ncbi:MAG: AMP-binding protein, partial [Myxococcales bacterium]|nr:AMP-binding protein [Myxococcales bacterium]